MPSQSPKLSALFFGYLIVLFMSICGWALWKRPVEEIYLTQDGGGKITAVIVLYLFSHLFRIARLALLSLDERKKVVPLAAAHSLTAFPSSFLPFKLGEILRLATFFWVFDYSGKALAVWFAERFGDVLVVSLLIIGLYFFKVNIPQSMQILLMIFVLASVMALVGLFAVAKVLVYLNRHLVLSSYSKHGLQILKISSVLRKLEMNVYKSLEGRFTAFLLLSVLIWSVEVGALSLFMNAFLVDRSNFAVMFNSGLLASLPGGGGSKDHLFGFYQSLALLGLTGISLLISGIILIMRSKRVNND